MQKKYEVTTQNIDDLGKLRGETLRKARHPCRNPPHGETDFYPNLGKVGNSVIEEEVWGYAEDTPFIALADSLI